MKVELQKYIFLFLGLLGLSGCQTDWYSTTSLAIAKHPDAATESLHNGVNEMYRSIAFGKVAGTEIPPRFWSAPIKAQHPIKVYEDGGNTVIVQKIVGGVEYGKYFMPPESSHVPEADFNCTRSGASFVYNYRRQLTR